MNSGIALPAGIAPIGPRNPHRTFKKNDGSSENPRFYNVEGEKSMRVHTQETLEISRALAINASVERAEREKLAYQSWLWSFTVIGQEPEFTRKIRSRTLRADGRWKISSKTVKKVLVCNLLGERWVNGSLAPKDEWGHHRATALEYRRRMQRSGMERKGNNRHDGTLNQCDDHPPEFTPNMSTQRATPGMETRARPPTLVELTLRYFLDNMDQSKKEQAEVVVSKPPEVLLPWNTQAVSVDNLIEYGTPANDPVATEASVESELEDLVYRRRARMLDREIRQLERELEEDVPKIESMVESELGEFEESTMTTPEEETARYLSWMRCPDVMLAALYTDSRNREVLLREKLEEFDRLHPSDFRNSRERYFESDETRLMTWLARRDVHNNRLRKLKPLHLDKALTNLERRTRITGYRMKAGRIDAKEAKDLLDGHFHQKKVTRWAAQAPVVVGGSGLEDWSREEKAQLMRHSYAGHSFVAHTIGLDHQIPMTDMEYYNMTRITETSVDTFVKDFMFEDIREVHNERFSQVAEVLAENSYKRVVAQMQKPIIGSIELGGAYEMDDESGFILPNFESPDLARVLDQVSK